MQFRELKYYKWSFEKNKVTLLEKRVNGEKMTLSMAMADSFVRAYISFKNNQRIEEKKSLADSYKTRNHKLVDLLRGYRNRNMLPFIIKK